MKLSKYISLFALTLAICLFSIVPASSQTSLQGLQGCSTDPVCAATLSQMAPAGSSALATVPIQTIPVAQPAAALFVPAGDSIAVGLGVAGLWYEWGDEFASLAANLLGWPGETAVGTGDPQDMSPYGGVLVEVIQPSGAVYQESALEYQFKDVFGVQGVKTTSCGGGVNEVQLKDGDTVNFSIVSPHSACFPTPGPELEEIYDIEGIIDIAPAPQQIPYPTVQVGGQTETLPYILPASEELPVIVIQPNPAGTEPEYRTEPLILEEGQLLDENGNPIPGQVGENVTVEFPDINPADPQSSGCSGWGYAWCQLQDNFPFDVIGTMPTLPAEPPCPSFTFFTETMEFCWLKTLLDGLIVAVTIGVTLAGVQML